MIEFKTGDIFESTAHALVNPVNCEGVMGNGLALSFKNRFPGLFEAYKNDLFMSTLGIGEPMIWKGPRWVVNFATKESWRKPSKMEYIEWGLKSLRERLADWGVTSIALPRLGCGLGGLAWADVKPLVEKYLGDLTIPVEVYE